MDNCLCYCKNLNLLSPCSKSFNSFPLRCGKEQIWPPDPVLSTYAHVPDSISLLLPLSLFGSCIYYFVFFQWSRLSDGIELEWEFQLHRKVNFLAIGQIKTLTSFKSYVISSDKIIPSKVLRVPKFSNMLEFAQTCQIHHLCLKVWHKVQF